ncbi:hypothetical protein [Aerosakkonema funiforme]|uniref:hypothetical protein n=2 Tax=Aerosakkonema TaxID=1246629 RepID=UPI0035BAC429
MAKMLSKNASVVSTSFLIFVILLSGLLNHHQLTAYFYFMRFQWAQADNVKCQNLLQVLKFSRDVDLNSVIQTVYSSKQYELRRGVLLFGEYAVAEISEIERSDLHIALFKKVWRREFQKIYSCSKNMG